MYTTGFGGGSTNRSSYVFGVGHTVYSDYAGVWPTGNPSSDGGNPVVVYSASVIGLSGGHTSLAYLGGSSIRIHCISDAGTMNFGRLNDNGVNTIDAADSSAFSPRGGLCGSFTWGTVGGAPSMIQATPQPGGTILAQFGGSGDTGGIGMDGNWQLWWRVAGGSWNAMASTGTTYFAGVPGTTYEFKSRGHNAVGWSAFSGSLFATAKSGGKVSVGGVWKTGVTRVSIGGVWRDCVVKVSVGGTWKDVI